VGLRAERADCSFPRVAALTPAEGHAQDPAIALVTALLGVVERQRPLLYDVDVLPRVVMPSERAARRRLDALGDEASATESLSSRTRSNAGRPRCGLPLAGTVSYDGRLGANSFRFTGRLRARKLPPGDYRLAATPVDAAGNLGATRRVAVTIVED
jgi:hypothetical protein